MPALEGSVEQQDSRGWTPVMWSASNGYSKLVKQLIHRGANVHHMGQARGGSGTTMALHEAAAMRADSGQAPEAFYETAWLLLSAGASPFTERSDGATPVEVAASYGNLKMKTFLEGCALFRGTLAMPIPQTFGSKIKARYCTVQPRFPFGNAAPTLSMVCYKSLHEPQPTCRIPLENARVVIEGMQDSNAGFIIIPGSGRSLKGVAIKSHTSNSFIIEIKAVGTAAMPSWKTLRTLADVCKAAAVAASCRNLDQLCAAALRQATRQMRIPGTNAVPDSEGNPLQGSVPEGKPGFAPQTMPGPGRTESKGEGEQPGPIADSAEDMTPQSAATSQQVPEDPLETEPSTPRSSQASDLPRRSSGLAKLFMSPFRRSNSGSGKLKYNPQNLDSSSSLGHVSNASTSESGRKSGLWSGLKKMSISTRPSRAAMPSITEQSGGGLTAADIDALSQPIPDKFWSKIGRKMSNQRVGANRYPLPQQGTAKPDWFHRDEGTLDPSSSPAQPRRSFNYNDLDELMYPAGRAAADQGARDSSFAGLNGSQPRPATDRLGAHARQNGTVPFVLEEPIVPTQEMVPTGPRRSFSFDDLDDLVGGASRKARGHRESFLDQLGSTQPLPPPGPARSAAFQQQMATGPRARPLVQSSRSLPPQHQRDARLMTQPDAAPPGYLQRVPARPAPPGAPRSRQAAPFGEEPVRLPARMGGPMPRRSFSFHDLDELLRPPPAQPPVQAHPSQMQSQRDVQEDLQAWHANQSAAGTPRRKGPLIDPFSHGGYQGQPAPEWRPYRPPSARTTSSAQQAHVQSLPIQQVRMPAATRQPPNIPTPAQAAPPQLRQHSATSLRSSASGGMPQPVPQQMPQQMVPHQKPQQMVPQQMAQQRPQQHAAPKGTAPQYAQHPMGHAPSQLSVDGVSKTPGSEAANGGKQSGGTDKVVPPELAHLMSLRPLETENLSTASAKDQDKTSSNNSQDIADVVYTSAHGPEAWAAGSPRADAPVKVDQAASNSARSPPAAPLADPQTKVVGQSLPAVSAPAVPAVLFQGTKVPKISTPPQRIAKERVEDLNGSTMSQVVGQSLPAVSAPAVPAVLFQGTKVPKISTPPQRIAKERVEDLNGSTMSQVVGQSLPAVSAPAVPAVLFQGTKVPKISTPPQRITEERTQSDGQMLAAVSPGHRVQVAPAVPAVLFQGAKVPKISTPPQRIAKERVDDVPDFPLVGEA